MKTTQLIGIGALVGVIAIAGAAALSEGESQDQQGPPTVPAEPHKNAVQLLHAQRFNLDAPATHFYREEQMKYTSGWLLVLSTNSDLVFPRETAEPVLYVGKQTAERVNKGWPSGRIVAIVPGDFFLVGAPIFFGTPQLPEQVNAQTIERELAKARDAGVVGLTADQVARATQDPLPAMSLRDLSKKAIDLVAKFSPQEDDLIRGNRVPEVR